MMGRRSWLRAAVVLGLGGLLAGRWAAVSVADDLWARSLGVQATHTAISHLKLTLLALAFTLAAVWVLGNLYLVYRTIGSVHVPRRLGNLEIVEAVPRRYLLYGVVGLGLGIALIVSHGAPGWWTSFALLGNHPPVGLRDPILNRDAGYYLFRLPWDRTLHGYLATLSAVMLVVTGALYGLLGAIRVPHRRLVVADWARSHLAGLLVVFGLVLAAGFRLDAAEYVAGLHTVPYDAVLVDVRMPVSRLLTAVAGLVAIASLIWVWVDRVALVVVPWSALAIFALVGTFVVPGFSAAMRGRDQLGLPQLETAQRRMLSIAFGLPVADTTLDLPGVPAPDLYARRGPEVALAPIWDGAAITDVLNRVATRHPYERFSGVGLSLYRGPDGQPIPTYVGAREIDLLAAREADPALSWASVHGGAFNHASGAAAVLAARASDAGLPLFVPTLARPDSAVSGPTGLALENPELYFGPGAEQYAIVPSASARGISPGGLGRRLALAWTLQSLRMLSRVAVAPAQVVLWRRAVAERLDHYAPFARFGAPYAVVAGHRLWWLSWGYVSAQGFPLSVLSIWRRNGVRYLRASLLGVVDAGSGETAVYLADDPDPLSAAWAALAPDVVRPRARLPAELAPHLRYPDELFAVQLPVALGGAPVGVPRVRTIPGAPASGAGGTVPAPMPTWIVGTLPGDDTLRLRLRAAAEQGDPPALVALADGYVQGARPVLRVARLARAATQPDPSRFAAQTARELDPPTTVAGPVKTLVFAGGVLLLRSVFEVPASDSQPPRLREIVVGGGSAVGRGAEPGAALRDLAAASRRSGASAAEWSEAYRWFRRLDDARRVGDWSAFGRAYQQLRRLLTRAPDSVP